MGRRLIDLGKRRKRRISEIRAIAQMTLIVNKAGMTDWANENNRQ